MLCLNNQTHKWWILFVISIITVMVNMDYTVVNLALITISKDIHSPLREIQWVLSGFALAWAAFVLPSGRLADVLGRSYLFLIGVAFFTLASVLAGLANTGWLLTIARTLQGTGGALLAPSAMGIIFSSFPPKQQGIAVGILGTAIGLGLGIGPSFGSLILHLLSWRWIFFINLPLGLFVFVISLLLIPKEDTRTKESIDYLGILTLSVGLFGIMFAINEVHEWEETKIHFVIILIGSLLLLSLFLGLQIRKKNPLIRGNLFLNRVFLACNCISLVYQYSFSLVLIVTGLYLQNVLGYSTIQTGFLFLFMTLIFGLLAPFGGKIVSVMDSRIPIAAGMI